jgi:hypothetical protein
VTAADQGVPAKAGVEEAGAERELVGGEPDARAEGDARAARLVSAAWTPMKALRGFALPAVSSSAAMPSQRFWMMKVLRSTTSTTRRAAPRRLPLRSESWTEAKKPVPRRRSGLSSNLGVVDVEDVARAELDVVQDDARGGAGVAADLDALEV